MPSNARNAWRKALLLLTSIFSFVPWQNTCCRGEKSEPPACSVCLSLLVISLSWGLQLGPWLIYIVNCSNLDISGLLGTMCFLLGVLVFVKIPWSMFFFWWCNLTLLDHQVDNYTSVAEYELLCAPEIISKTERRMKCWGQKRNEQVNIWGQLGMALTLYLVCCLWLFAAISVMIDESGQMFHKHDTEHNSPDGYPVAGSRSSCGPFGSSSDSTLFMVERDTSR